MPTVATWSGIGFATVGALLVEKSEPLMRSFLTAGSGDHAPVEDAFLTKLVSPMLQPAAPPESSPVMFPDCIRPAVPSTTTKYVVSAASMVFAGAVNLFVPVVSDDGLLRVANTVPDAEPVTIFTLTPLGFWPSGTSTSVRV